MKKKLFPIKLYIKHKPNLYILSFGFVLNLMSWIWLIWNIRPQENNIFLHYTALFGVDLIGPWQQVFYLPLVGLCIMLVNAFVGWMLFREDKTIGYISLGIAAFLQLIIFISSHLLVLLNV